MTRRNGLGKGLGALLPSTTSSTGEMTSSLREVPLDAVIVNPNQPRVHFDEETLASLAASIRELGVLQPILVRETGVDRYELIAGERRWRASQAAGLETVPVIVREVDDTESLEQALVENLHRQDLNPLEEAAAYKQLIEDFNITHDAVAARVGKSRVAVTNTLRLLQLPAPIQRLVVDGQLSAGHARALLGTSDGAFQDALAKRSVKENLSVRAVEEAVRLREELGSSLDLTETGPNAVQKNGAGKLRPAALMELEQLLADYLNTRVSIDMGTKRGKIDIEFSTLEDLERIYKAMTAEKAHR